MNVVPRERIARVPLLRSRIGGIIAVTVGLILGLIVVLTPLEAEQQVYLALGGLILLLIANRFRGRTITIGLAVLSSLVSVRYIYWRITETLDFSSVLQTFFGTGLVLAELYAVITLLLSYFQCLWPLDRKPVPLPDDVDSWPMVDVFVPTYNEPLEVVKPAVFAALALDWPRDRLNVVLLDDGRRDEFRRFCAETGCGYMIRPDNRGAKAGNINAALARTSAEYVLILDCDHVATRFLQLTMGWMLRDRDLAMIQTPHHFYSPDPFERNLTAGYRVPNEGLLFYGLIQQGNDFWGGTFFCGSAAVIRRTALEEVGGVPTETVTEDCHASLKMQKRGWRTAYLRVPLVAGLATERLMLHIGQRMRWARGMIQIMRLENPLLSRGLSLPQRLCYFMSMFHFLFPLPRFVFLTAPLAYLLFGSSIIAASPLAIVAYAGPHIFHSIVTASRIQGRVRHSFWSEIYETVLAVYLLPVMLATLLDPKRGKFNVTDKGGTLDEGYFDVRAVGPNMIIGFLLMLGLLFGIRGLAVNPPASLEFQAFALNVAWATLCLLTVLAGLAVGRERRQLRERARIVAEVPAAIVLPDGRRVPGETRDLSLGGAAVAAEVPVGLPENALVMLEMEIGQEIVPVPAEVLRWQDGRLQLRFRPRDLRDEGQIVRAVLGRADAWMNWDVNPVDHPLRSLRDVTYSIGGLFRGDSQLSLRRSRRGGPADTVIAVDATQAERSRRNRDRTRRAAAVLLALGLGLSGPAAAQFQPQTPPTGSAAPAAPPGTAIPTPGAGSLPPRETNAPGQVSSGIGAAGPVATVPALPQPTLSAGTPDPATGQRQLTQTLRQFGLRAPMQLRGTSDLQGVIFGVRGDEVVTQARLVLQGATSPALIPELSQIAITLNEQFIGAIQPDRARPAFGPLEFPVNPVFFADANRLNFRFSGRYAIECNDNLSGLLWATISENSALALTLERLPLTRDLARLPEPFFDPRILREPLNLPIVIPDNASNDAIRAATIVATWFAVQADYRGAEFPAPTRVPERGNAVVVATGVDAIPGLTLPRFDGPTLALVQNPSDPYGLLLVVGGRSGAEAATAAATLAVARESLSGELALIPAAPQIVRRQPYDAPRWVRTDRPVRFGDMVDPSELQAFGYAPGPITVPFRTAPDLYTFRNRPFSSDIRFRAPPGPVVDVAVSRLDTAVNDVYLRSFALRDSEPGWPFGWLSRQIGTSERNEGRFGLPPWMVFGQNELQFRFDMRPLNRGDCVAVPGDIRASIDPDSTLDLSGGYRFATLPNLSHFSSSGYPFTVLADLSGSAAVLPERPTPDELSTYLGLMGRIAAMVGLPATGLQVVRPGGLDSVADRDLIVIGAIGRQPALDTLLRDAPVRVDGNTLSIALPTAVDDFRHVFGAGPRGEKERARAQLAAPGEGLGLLIGFESPLRSGKSVLALTGTSQPATAAMLTAMRDPDQLPRIQGDLSVLSNGRVSSYRVQPDYTRGALPPWLWPQFYLADNPWLILGAIILAVLLISIPLYWFLRRRAALRLRERTT